jgi:hypothetical protein
MAIQNETELYLPIKLFFEQRGYEVRAEVNHCDLLAVHPERSPVIVELKKTLNIPLLVQGIQRLSLTDQVYIAIELPGKGKVPHGLKWKEITQLCGMLGIGFLTVQYYKSKKPSVEVVCEPKPYVLRTNNKKKQRLMQEFHGRSGDYNVGGSTRQALVTAYRERALHCAQLIHQHGPLSPRKLREFTGYKALPLLLRRNVYAWFARKERGVYQLTATGELALEQYASILENVNRIHPTTASAHQ